MRVVGEVSGDKDASESEINSSREWGRTVDPRVGMGSRIGRFFEVEPGDEESADGVSGA